MRRLAFASAFSLLLCSATVVLWVGSSLREWRVSRTIFGTRYSVSSEAGHVSLYRPPPLPSRSNEVAKLSALVAQIGDDQIQWEAIFRRYSNQFDHLNGPMPRTGTAADRIILHRPLRLDPVIRLPWDRSFSQRVLLHTCLHKRRSLV